MSTIEKPQFNTDTSPNDQPVKLSNMPDLFIQMLSGVQNPRTDQIETV